MQESNPFFLRKGVDVSAVLAAQIMHYIGVTRLFGGNLFIFCKVINEHFYHKNFGGFFSCLHYLWTFSVVNAAKY